MAKPDKPSATRFEIRNPDPACNPYLAFSVLLAAGLEGVEKKYKLQEPSNENVYELTPEMRAKKGIDSLPGSLIEAIHMTERSELVKRSLGEHIFSHFIENKKIEWDKHRIQISSYELSQYLPLL